MMKLAIQSKFFLPLLTAASVFACGGSAGSPDDDDDSGGSGGGSGASPSVGGTDGEGGDGEGGDGGSTASGGSTNPGDKPDPVEDYPCYGERREFEVDNSGAPAAEAHRVTRFYYDEQGNTLRILEDEDNSGSFETGHYWTFDDAGNQITWGFDNDGDEEFDSRADYFYDNLGLLLSVDYYNPADDLSSNYSVNRDERGRILTVQEVLTNGNIFREEKYEWLADLEYNHLAIQYGALQEASHIVTNEYEDPTLEEVWLDAEMTVFVSRTTTSYDNNSRPVTEEIETDSGVQVTESSYAPSGLIEKEEIEQDTLLVRIAEYTYFDECVD